MQNTFCLIFPTIGNRNNFANQKACQSYCLSESCPPGTVVAKESDSSRLMKCSNPGGAGRLSGGCPEGYSCYSSVLLGQNVCCGASTDLQCKFFLKITLQCNLKNLKL